MKAQKVMGGSGGGQGGGGGAVGRGEEASVLLPLELWRRVLTQLDQRQDLAQAALTCRLFANAARALHDERAADITSGLEAIPVRCVNDESAERYPPMWGAYVTRCVLAGGKELPKKDSTDGCVPSSCECLSFPSGVPHYTPCGLLFPSSLVRSLPSLRECGPACCCLNSLESCRNRVTQRGLSVACCVRMTANESRGWGLYAAQEVEAGQFVCEYAGERVLLPGELLTTPEQRRRQVEYDTRGMLYVLVVREVLPSRGASLRINIDPTRYGNVARFINHSCDPNLTAVLVRECGGWPVPAVALVASRRVRSGEEFTMSYGDITSCAGDNLQPTNPCLCGAASCCGMMPREPV
eukprot:jgi/Chlat1/1365/Chrsp119S01766